MEASLVDVIASKAEIKEMHARIDDAIHPISKAGKYTGPGSLLIRNKFLFKRNEPDRAIKDVLPRRLRPKNATIDLTSAGQFLAFTNSQELLFFGYGLSVREELIVRNGRIK